ncbi:conjugal transfer protein [Mycolicibacterium septicum]|uniref:conjugal transfer protein n=1 Tax=Mycolicibacterium septicum TaxID=98668 RepID=UPI002362A4CE|nr:conjugal transfer protein [Mycolicibacterium septicum]
MSSTDSWLTKTWRRRLTNGRGLIRGTAVIVGFAACTLVALNTVWSWITDTPIDVVGPSRAVVNRTDYVGGYAKTCVRLLLTATESQRSALFNCWSPTDIRSLPTTVPVIVDATEIAKIVPIASVGGGEQWQVVVRVNQRAYVSATPQITLRQITVLFTDYGLRAAGLPATLNDGGFGASLPLAYPTTLPVGKPDSKGGTEPTNNPVSDTVSGFLHSYLTSAGGLERYTTSESGLIPVSTCRSGQLTALLATSTGAAGNATPADGTTVRVWATVSEITNEYTPRTEQYPLTLAVRGGRWSVTGIDAGPLLDGNAELTPAAPAPTNPQSYSAGG